MRRGAIGVAAVVAILLVVLLVPLPGVSCDVSLTKECGPGDEAIGLVQADAYAYLHADTDPGSGQFEQARELAERLPHFGAIAQGSFQALGVPGNVVLSRDVLPWLGSEAAAALVPAQGGAAQQLLLLSVADESGARSFLRQVGGSGSRGEQRGTAVTTYRNGLASAELNGFLLLGGPAAVRGAIDAAGDGGDSLADDETAQDVRSSLPDERVADAYVSREGIARLLAGRPGAAGTLDTFADFGASRGLAAAAVAHDDGIELQLSSSLDPEEARAAPPFFAAFPEFTPEIASALPADTLAMLDIGDPSQTARALLEQADAAVPGISAAFDRLDRQLSRAGGIGIEHGLLPLLDGEAAVAVAPGRPVPYVTMIFDGVDEQRANDAVLSLQAPLIGAVNPATTGQAPTLSQRKIGGVTVHSINLSPAVDLTYAVSGGRLVIASAPRGVEQAHDGSDDLASQDSYRTVASPASDGTSALLFLNLQGLVQLAAPRGLAGIVSSFRQDLAKMKALGVSVKSSEDRLETKAFLEID
jgi:hypothetical protein